MINNFDDSSRNIQLLEIILIDFDNFSRLSDWAFVEVFKVC